MFSQTLRMLPGVLSNVEDAAAGVLSNVEDAASGVLSNVEDAARCSLKR